MTLSSYLNGLQIKSEKINVELKKENKFDSQKSMKNMNLNLETGYE